MVKQIENVEAAAAMPAPSQRRPVVHNNKVDEADRPAGGTTHGYGFSISWQDGPTAGIGRNGAFVEEVIEAAIGRLDFYQSTQFHCIENAVAVGHLISALEVLNERTRGRQARGVEGTHLL